MQKISDNERINTHSLLMFNRQIGYHRPCHNIRNTMGKSKKRTPAGTNIGRSQKRGKQKSHGRFRRLEHTLVHCGKYDLLPYRQIEITSPYDLGGDGKSFWGYHPEEEWFIKAMRK